VSSYHGSGRSSRPVAARAAAVRIRKLVGQKGPCLPHQKWRTPKRTSLTRVCRTTRSNHAHSQGDDDKSHNAGFFFIRWWWFLAGVIFMVLLRGARSLPYPAYLCKCVKAGLHAEVHFEALLCSFSPSLLVFPYTHFTGALWCSSPPPSPTSLFFCCFCRCFVVLLYHTRH
jgi:hypothetical protein